MCGVIGNFTPEPDLPGQFPMERWSFHNASGPGF